MRAAAWGCTGFRHNKPWQGKPVAKFFIDLLSTRYRSRKHLPYGRVAKRALQLLAFGNLPHLCFELG